MMCALEFGQALVEVVHVLTDELQWTSHHWWACIIAERTAEMKWHRSTSGFVYFVASNMRRIRLMCGCRLLCVHLS